MRLPSRPDRISSLIKDGNFAVIGTMLAAIILGGIGWLLTDSQEASYDSAVRASERSILSLEHDIRRPIENLDRALLKAVSVTKLNELNSLPSDMLQAALFDGAAGADAFGAMYISDPTGQIVYDSIGAPPRNISIADSDYFQRQRANADVDFLLAGPVLNKLNGRWVLVLSRRISGADGRFAGLAVGSVDLDMLQQILDRAHLENGGRLSLFETDGVLIFAKPSSGTVIGRDISRAEVIRQITDKPSGVVTASSVIDGIERVVAYRRIGSYPLAIGLGLSRDDLYAIWLRQLLLATSIMAVTGFVAGGLAWYLYRKGTAYHSTGLENPDGIYSVVFLRGDPSEETRPPRGLLPGK